MNHSQNSSKRVNVSPASRAADRLLRSGWKVPRTGCSEAGGNEDLFLLVTRAYLLHSLDKVVLVTGVHGFTAARCREP